MSRKEATPIGDIDFSTITFGPLDTKNNISKVELFLGQEMRLKPYRVALCRDAATKPMKTRFRLDTLRDDQPGDKRGLALVVDDPEVVAALSKIDEMVVNRAIECSKEWFKKPLSPELVRDRYQPILSKYGSDDKYMMKVKVKVATPTTAMRPTELHLASPDGHRKNAATLDDLTQGASVAPIVSMTYGIYIAGGGMKFGVSIYADEIIVCPNETRADDLSYFPSSVPLKMADGVGFAKRPREEDGEEVPEACATGEAATLAKRPREEDGEKAPEVKRVCAPPGGEFAGGVELVDK